MFTSFLFFKFDVHYVLVGRKGPQPRKTRGRIADTLPYFDFFFCLLSEQFLPQKGEE